MRVPERIGTWEGGILYGTFRDTRDVGLAVVRGLTNLQQRGERAELEPAAQARAADLAAAARREGYTQSGAFARVVLVPLLDPPLLDAVALDEQTLAEELAGAARASRLVPHSLGITTRASAAGVTLEVGERHSANAYTLSVGRNGEIVAEASVTGTDTFGSMRVVPDRVREAVEGAIAFAERAWQRTDPRGEVQEAAAAIAIPHAEHRSWAEITAAARSRWRAASGCPRSHSRPSPPSSFAAPTSRAARRSRASSPKSDASSSTPAPSTRASRLLRASARRCGKAPSLSERQRSFASRGDELQHAFELVRDGVHRRGAHPLRLPRIQDSARCARGPGRVRVGSMSELAPAAAETRPEVDRSTDPDVELEGLPPAMRHLMPVVPDPVDHSLIAVGVAWSRLRPPCVRVERRERCPKDVPLRKSVDDSGSGSILNIKAEVARLVHELSEHLNRVDEMEEEFLDELLAVVGIGASEIPAVEGDSSSFLLRAEPSRSRTSSAVSAGCAISGETYQRGEQSASSGDSRGRR